MSEKSSGRSFVWVRSKEPHRDKAMRGKDQSRTKGRAYIVEETSAERRRRHGLVEILGKAKPLPEGQLASVEVPLDQVDIIAPSEKKASTGPTETGKKGPPETGTPGPTETGKPDERPSEPGPSETKGAGADADGGEGSQAGEAKPDKGDTIVSPPPRDEAKAKITQMVSGSGGIKNLTVPELEDCLDLLGLNEGDVKGTGSGGKPVKADLIARIEDELEK